ncbi:MAG: hypothetical protein F4Z71_01980 [Gammaproteobacteria bacterium]|nr:hypothetical protein [Gammaproteobacteria bacterium]MYE30246.1 hypothetical protein [Gammaproteobacteria bacterium]
MSRRRVGLVILCEDRQQEVFFRKFFEEIGWNLRQIRFETAPRGKGSAKQYVVRKFPNELAGYRAKKNKVNSKLIVVVDGDKPGVLGSINELKESCLEFPIEPRKNDEAVAIFVPTWNIETWLAYLVGGTVDETKRNYSRLGRPRECQKHVKILVQMCQNEGLRKPAPESLRIACEEYQTRLN